MIYRKLNLKSKTVLRFSKLLSLRFQTWKSITGDKHIEVEYGRHRILNFNCSNSFLTKHVLGISILNAKGIFTLMNWRYTNVLQTFQFRTLIFQMHNAFMMHSVLLPRHTPMLAPNYYLNNFEKKINKTILFLRKIIFKIPLASCMTFGL